MFDSLVNYMECEFYKSFVKNKVKNKIRQQNSDYTLRVDLLMMNNPAIKCGGLIEVVSGFVFYVSHALNFMEF